MEIDDGPIGVEAVPVDEQVWRIVGPLLVFVEFFSHENHGDARSGKQNTGGDTGPTGGIPGTRIAASSKSSDTRIAVFVDFVVALQALHRLPCIRKTGSSELVDDGLPVYLGVAATAGVAKHFANGATEPIVPLSIESGAIFVLRADDSRFRAPVFGDVDGGSVRGVQCAIEVLENSQPFGEL